MDLEVFKVFQTRLNLEIINLTGHLYILIAFFSNEKTSSSKT